MNNKVYARQIPPEYQESPLYTFGEWPENVYVFGNRDFNDHSGRLEAIRRGLEDIAEEYELLQTGYYQNYTLNELITNYLPRDNEREYARGERLELVKLAQNYSYYSNSSSAENDILCAVLELITGQKYENATIRGCCQGDWQNIIYPAEYGREWLESFETEYFNTGTEWIVHDDETPPECPEDITGFSVYCLGWNDKKIRAEIAEYANVEPERVTLYGFSGWTRSAAYMEV